METLIVQPDSKEKLDAIKAFMKALKIPFKASKLPHNADFVAKSNKEMKILKQEGPRKFHSTMYGNKIF